MQFSHSRIETFERCKFLFRLRYLDELTTIPDTTPDNALILGTALHTGIEEGVAAALDYYSHAFPVLTDDHITEMIKLEYLIPLARSALPDGGLFEQRIEDEDFLGFSDYYVPVTLTVEEQDAICDACPNRDTCSHAYGGASGGCRRHHGFVDLYDFKYSNNIKRYMESGQLHEYKFYLEKTHPGLKVRKAFFLFVPKISIKPKAGENLTQFRSRLMEKLKDAQITIKEVPYDPAKVISFLSSVKHAIECRDFPKEPSRLCGWCEYNQFCEKGVDYMILPENKRRDLNAMAKKVIWVYGAPFSGKTFFANQFPDPLMLNTDGNIRFIDAPYIAIKDTVKVEGRITIRKLAWEVFSEAVAELEKKQNDFKTIVVDLLEDCYEACRVFICDRQDWKHESDDSFKAWDMVQTEFLTVLKRLMGLNYDNIVLISHEDRTRDLTRKSGDKISSIRPNMREKVANKVAGMVDLVARIVAEDDERTLSFKSSEVIFGGGRLTVRDREIPLTYDAFCEIYEEANSAAVKAISRAERKTQAQTQAPREKDRRGRGNGRMEGENGQDPDNDVDQTEQATPSDLPPCPDAARIFAQHEENPKIPLCPNLTADGGCSKKDGPDGCALLDKPQKEDQEETQDPPPRVRHTRKKRGDN